MIDLSQIPHLPGVYFFLDPRDRILYIGKAKDLRNRVRSYFSDHQPSLKTRILVKKIDKIDFILTDNELEALILENNLIKKNQPRYNIDLKDSKTYAYILLTDEPFPRLISVRDKTRTGRYFGPFPSASDRNRILHAVRDIFKLRTCRKFRKKPCLRSQIDLCRAPCARGISAEEYRDNVEAARRVLKGQVTGTIRDLKSRMEEYSLREQYETALSLREQIQALEGLREKQKIERHRQTDEDIIHYLVEGEKVYLMRFNIDRGVLINKEEYSFDRQEGFFAEFLGQYYSSRSVPRELVLPGRPEPALLDYLKSKNPRCKVIVPRRGEKKKLLELVHKNLEHLVFPKRENLRSLQEALHLPGLPRHIECFDISHLAGRHTTASMVCFTNGIPDKSEYRRFRIRSHDQIDDVASMAEVVRRRYRRQLREQNPLPDLVIIDGGRGQLNAALKVLRSLEQRIPIIALAKQHEEIHLPDAPRPLRLDPGHPGLNLIRGIRDESHRFALKYNRLLREKDLIP